MNTQKRIPTCRLSLPLTLLAAVLLAGAITLLALWCQPNALRGVLSGFLSQPLLIVLNALPIGLLLLAVTCLFRNVFWAAAAVNFVVGALSIANRIKLEVRDEPVFPRDFGLLKEVGSAMSSYHIRFPIAAIAVVLAATVLLVLLGCFVGCRPFPIRRLRGLVGGLLGAAVSLGALTALIFTLYASNTLYNSFAVSNAYYIPSVFNELGFPYCFCHQFTTYPIEKPEGFSKAEAAAWESGTSYGQGKPVHLIMVMNEAFSDLTDAEVFTYSEAADPLSNLHALQQDPHAVSGHVVVPGFAGGTANTEFDVLTGIQTNALSDSATSAFRVVNRNLESVLRVFANDGYQTAFYHPGDAWFYNRENVYRWLGAKESVFASQMNSPVSKGRWVTDDYLAGYLETAFSDAVAQGQMLCTYTTTIQNHMSYTADKYGADYVYPPVETSVPLSSDVETLLRVYVEGVRDADAMLGRLKAAFSATDEPVVLAFWGDHLPYLGDNQAGYAELGLDVSGQGEQDPLLGYETPYVIWANDAAAEMLDWDSAVSGWDLPADGRISASFLGAVLLEITGRKAETPWFSFLNELRRETPVVQKGLFETADGLFTREPSEGISKKIDQWRKWSYYKLRYLDVPS